MRMSTRMSQPLARLLDFFRFEAAGGIVLAFATLAALVLANSPLAPVYRAFLDVPVEVRLGGFEIAKPLLLWINDGLMAVFFLLVGLELKRELIEGHLSTPQKASLPAFAAVGGMVAPALIYLAFNRADEAAVRGWAIPAATDIAFALGVLALLGSRVPTALKAFLLSVAIFDDLGAIVIIAAFYTAKLDPTALMMAALLVGVLAVLHQMRVMRRAPYMVIGVLLWVAVLKSGVHATLAGVALALFIPLHAAEGADPRHTSESPLLELEHELHPWVAFGVLPLFAFANAGLPLAGLSLADLMQPVPLGIAAGLLLGKPIGVMLMALLATRLRVAALPDGIGWPHLLGAALLCGIGFTMSLFIASLAFEPGAMGAGLDRLGILAGSLASGVAGFFVLSRTLGRGSAAE